MTSENLNSYTNTINIIDRQTISISGLTKIISFDSNEFILDTELGMVGLNGRDMEIIKLDTYDGVINIKGIINGFSYLDLNDKKESIITKLFK